MNRHAARRHVIAQLYEFAAEGHGLRQAIERVAVASCSTACNAEQPVTRIYYHATSIYLSGVFDYDSTWQDYEVTVPTMTETAVQTAVEAILTYSELLLQHTTNSPMLPLVPLRIAGARVRTQSEIWRIRALLSCIRRSFEVASAFEADLEQVWASKGL